MNALIGFGFIVILGACAYVVVLEAGAWLDREIDKALTHKGFLTWTDEDQAKYEEEHDLS